MQKIKDAPPQAPRLGKKGEKPVFGLKSDFFSKKK